MNINLDYYKIFYYVGTYNGISAAAMELSISQPAVSQAIKQLENQLGTKLFIRTPKGVRFTSEGEVLYSYIKRGYEYMLLGEKKINEMINLQYGEIRIGASDMTLKYYLLPILEKFHEHYPKIKVNVTNGPTPDTVKMLQEGKIDFGVVSSPIKVHQGITVLTVKQIEDIFVAGNKYNYLKDKKISYKQLEELPIICLEKNTSSRKYVDNFLKDNGVILNPEFELATSDIIVQFALRNLGIASIVSEFAKKYINSGELFPLKFDKALPKRNFCIIADDNNHMSFAAEKLFEMLQ